MSTSWFLDGHSRVLSKRGSRRFGFINCQYHTFFHWCLNCSCFQHSSFFEQVTVGVARNETTSFEKTIDEHRKLFSLFKGRGFLLKHIPDKVIFKVLDGESHLQNLQLAPLLLVELRLQPAVLLRSVDEIIRCVDDFGPQGSRLLLQEEYPTFAGEVISETDEESSGISSPVVVIQAVSAIPYSSGDDPSFGLPRKELRLLTPFLHQYL
ncbi:hypothetical protein R1flu_022491 [Riccia fluitans]|uniref:Maturase K n=1 Tax=Riccia fluitans TaxID=41844 RepID=A0ABD1XPV5_9MARC